MFRGYDIDDLVKIVCFNDKCNTAFCAFCGLIIEKDG